MRHFSSPFLCLPIFHHIILSYPIQVHNFICKQQLLSSYTIRNTLFGRWCGCVSMVCVCVCAQGNAIKCIWYDDILGYMIPRNRIEWNTLDECEIVRSECMRSCISCYMCVCGNDRNSYSRKGRCRKYICIHITYTVKTPIFGYRKKNKIRGEKFDVKKRAKRGICIW